LGYLDYSIVLPLYASGIFWTLFYDTIYAHQDRVDDITVGIKSSALALGNNTHSVLTLFSGYINFYILTSHNITLVI
jgi:4-hydroxybenzoate polyprenyltransferase